MTEKAASPKVNMFKSAFKNFKSIFFTPRVFFTKPIFFIVCGVYGSTYVVANCIESFSKFQGRDPKYYKLAGTTVVNMGLGVLKDRWIAQNFNGKPPSSFPLISWTLFLLRDSMTIGAGFTLPPYFTDYLVDNNYFESRSLAAKVSQLVVPISAQFFLTPVHILALDLYNSKISTIAKRTKVITDIYVEATAIRWGRVLAAYGIAGIVNTGLRSILRDAFLPVSANSKV